MKRLARILLIGSMVVLVTSCTAMTAGAQLLALPALTAGLVLLFAAGRTEQGPVPASR